MSEFTEKLGNVKVAPKQKCVPKKDGEYILPDRRILIRQGDKFVIVGHRDKKRVRRLNTFGTEALIRLLKQPGFGQYSKKDLQDLGVDELSRLILPRPRIYFCLSWLLTSESDEARKLKKLVRQAEEA